MGQICARVAALAVSQEDARQEPPSTARLKAVFAHLRIMLKDPEDLILDAQREVNAALAAQRDDQARLREALTKLTDEVSRYLLTEYPDWLEAGTPAQELAHENVAARAALAVEDETHG